MIYVADSVNHTTRRATASGVVTTLAGLAGSTGSADGTGGSFELPLRAFKLGSMIPVKFVANCGGSPVISGQHTLQAIKYSTAVDVRTESELGQAARANDLAP